MKTIYQLLNILTLAFYPEGMVCNDSSKPLEYESEEIHTKSAFQ